MNVFVLCTGRCGSLSFVRACEQIENFSAGHESLMGKLGDERVAYPDAHIEADNRLVWLLGRLEQRYGTEAFYVHLRRAPEKVAQSFARRERGILPAYRRGIMWCKRAEPLAVARDYCRTVTENIEYFLRDKPQRMDFWIESAEEDFPVFWERIGASGDLQAALAAFRTPHNASQPQSWLQRLLRG